ncbi:MAG TPA: PilN domain-containing protein [Syntrophobacteraceae bacterium]|nr:PilN domain-containing protein [Syntrophobacteraceae bacterium]
MIQINLLPVRLQKQKEGARQIASIYLLSIVLAGAIIGFLWIRYDGEIGARKKELSSLQQEVGKYARFEAALQQIQKTKEIVDKKREVIKDLQGDRDAVVRMLALLSIQVPPEKMWFDKLTQTGSSVTLDGVAQSNEAIVEFMRNLEASPYIEKGSINLVLSRQFAVREMKLREFQLTYRFYTYSEVQKKLKM